MPNALGYCPLDLYSGVESRVLRALHALWDAWIASAGQVNNLRVFVDGILLTPTQDVRIQFQSLSVILD